MRLASEGFKGSASGLGVAVRRRRKAEADKWEEGSREHRMMKTRMGSGTEVEQEEQINGLSSKMQCRGEVAYGCETSPSTPII